MLYRKIEKTIREHLKNDDKILIVEGARQVGKTFIIRKVIQELFKNVIEINLLEDSLNNRIFSNVSNVKDFYFQLSMLFGDKMGNKENTIIFLDEIQENKEFISLLKFLKNDNKFTFIASGSLLGVSLSKIKSIPMGSIKILKMFPLDFEEFIIANGANEYFIQELKEKMNTKQSLEESVHNKMIDLFKKYLLIGGLPDAVNSYLNDYNIYKVREIQKETYRFYIEDASKYDNYNKLKIKRIYELIPSNLENKKKRVVIQDIENIKGKRYSNYIEEFDYLINSGVVLDVKAISNPIFPLIQSTSKNLLKLYLNDVGIFTGILYSTNIMAVMNNLKSINLGSVYESVVAQELIAHNHNLYYYDNRHNGEVDFLIDDYVDLSVLPIEIKSGKDYQIHSALNKLIANPDYNIKKGIVLSNDRLIKEQGSIIYYPIYFIMFL